MTAPFFSIVIPVYNRSVILKDRLDYLLKQRYKDFEVVIVDDGSNDYPAGTLAGILSENKNIRLITQQNSERGAARNNGIKNSNGKYIVLFDSDDFMHDDHLLKLNGSIVKNNFPDFIATKFNFRDENDKIHSSPVEQFDAGKYDYRLFLNGNPLACNICFKRDIDGLILFEEDRNFAIKEDWMFLISNLRNREMLLLDYVTISMFDHKNRSMRSDNRVIISRTKKAVEWIVKNLKLNSEEVNKLFSHQNYFCGIHAYLNGDRKESISFALNAISKGGLQMKFIKLLVKSLIGRKLILKLK